MVDASTGEWLRDIGKGLITSPWACTTSKHRNELFVSSQRTDILVFDLTSGELLRKFDAPQRSFLRGLAVHGDLVLACDKTCVHVFSVLGERLFRFETALQANMALVTGNEAAVSVAVASNGLVFVSHVWETSTRFWDNVPSHSQEGFISVFVI